MEKLQHLSLFIGRLSSDKRLKPIHIALCIALCNEWISSCFAGSYQISRSLLMRASRIRSKATYHRVIKQLQGFGYLKYFPSYHPKLGSRVILMVSNDEKEVQ